MLPPLPPSLAALLADAIGEPVLDGEAGASVVRLTDPDGRARYLKHGVGRCADDVVDEMARLRWLAGRAPCPELLYFSVDGGGAWLLTSAVAGRTGDQWLVLDPGRLPAVIDGFARFLRDLHALPVVNCPFEAGADVRMAAARRNLDAGIVDTEDFDDDHAGWTGEQVWDCLQSLIPAPNQAMVTHGDFSLGNLLLDDSGAVTGVIDVGRLGRADPYQDIAILWQNLSDYGPAAQSRFLRAYGVEALDRQRLDFHRCLDEFF